MALETDRSALATLQLFREQEGFSGDGEIVVLKALSGDQLVIPNGTMLLVAEFVREGPDLLLIGPDGDRVLIQDYFTLTEPPVLMTEGGAVLPPDLVVLLAGPAAPGQYAQTEGGGEPQPIGRVDEMVGTVTASRVDGVTVTLSKDQRGLHYSIEVDENDPDHLRVLPKIERGDLSGSSFGFVIERASWHEAERDDGTKAEYREVESVRLLDVSPVTFPAYGGTDVTLRAAGDPMGGTQSPPGHRLDGHDRAAGAARH